MNKQPQQLNWPSEAEQKAYWEKKDEELSRTESACDWYDHDQDRGDLRDDGRSDGYGESYGERQ